MPAFTSARLCALVRSAILLASLGAPSAHAGDIVFDSFLQFSFAEAGTSATGCDPADPAGGFCIASSGTPTFPLDAPAWTFVAPAGGALLTVVDAFLSGDRFTVFDFGASLGSTSAPVIGSDCGDDPVPCLGDPGVSRGNFLLGAGPHALTLVAIASPDGAGSGYLRIAAVPEPGSTALFAFGMLVVVGVRGARRRPSEQRS